MAEFSFRTTIYIKDPGGFIAENVFAITAIYTGDQTVYQMAKALNEFVYENIITPYEALMIASYKVMAIQSKGIGNTPSPSAVMPVNEVGARTGTAAPGGVNGRIILVPGSGSTRISSFFVTGCGNADFPSDVASATITSLMTDLATALVGIDGSSATYAWQLVQWHDKTSTSTTIEDFSISPNPTLLNKRIRA